MGCLERKDRIPKKQFTDDVKLKKKETKYSREEIRTQEIKYGAETEGNVTQRLPHLGIHPICRHQTHTLLQMPRSAW